MIAYIFVCTSFIVLRRREPALTRPYRLPGGQLTGYIGLLASLVMAALYLPRMPAALVWPQEWMLVLAWFALGIVLLGSTDRVG